MAIRGSGFTLSNETGLGSIVVQFSKQDVRMEIEKSESVTSGGLLRTQIAGARAVITEDNVRMTRAQYLALVRYITQQATLYRYYESTVRPDEIPATDWPLSVSLDVAKKRQAFGGTADGIVYYLTLELKSTRLFTGDE